MKPFFAIGVIGCAVPMVWLVQTLAQVAVVTQDAFGAWQNHAVMQQRLAVPAEMLYAQEQRFAPTSAYKQESIHGFTVLINPAVLKHPAAATAMRQELAAQLSAITRVMPAPPLSTLKPVRIWVEWETQHSAATFHPSAVWLSQHGYNPEKAGCIEISNTSNFVRWSRTDQPWMLMHELAHAYQHFVLGDTNIRLRATYQHAVEQKRYASVSYIQGGKQKAYALTNEREYFAELSEAYFGKNDFYPFTRTELKTYDPMGYQLLEQAWGVPRTTDRTH